MLVLSGVNYEQKDSLYTQTQKSMKKFKGDGSSCGGSRTSSFSQPAIKVEPTYFTRGGYRPPNTNIRPTSGSYRGAYGNSWQGSRPSMSGIQNSWRNTSMNGQSWRNPSFQGSYQRGFSARGRGNDSSTAYRPPFRRYEVGEKQLNPTGKDGNILTCDSCKSIRHFIKDCPHTWENLKRVHIADSYENEPNSNEPQHHAQESYPYQDSGASYAGQEEFYDEAVQYYDGEGYSEYSNYNSEGGPVAHVVLFTGYNKNDLTQLQIEAHNSAVLDSACSSTVCGKAWLEDFLSSRSSDDTRPVLSRPGYRQFKFGGGVCLKSTAEYCLPVFLAGQSISIQTDVVDSDIPLLLSKPAMKKAGVIIDTVNDCATIFGRVVTLNSTSSGHYCVPIVNSEAVCMVESLKFADDDQEKSLKHLHKQMGHPRREKFINFIKDANSWQDKFSKVIDKICDECDKCKELAKTPSRPVVSLPMATHFNDKVAMDLKVWEGKYILHLIDMWSRYTISVFVSRKTKETIIENIIVHWIGYFGIMKTILSDNGGEFRNDEMREVCSIVNVEILTTAAESPFQNGLCEKNHAITDMILLKLRDDYPNVKIDVLLRWANMSKNSLQMCNGYSSNQLVFGVNPNLPNIFDANLPALEENTISRTLAEHLNILHSSRKAFIESECSDRIRRALRNRIRASSEVFNRGDAVYYKRDHNLRWLGPAKVVFQDRKVVLLDHGGYYIKVSPNLLQKTHNQFNIPDKSCNADSLQKSDDNNHKKLEEASNVNSMQNSTNDNPVMEDTTIFGEVKINTQDGNVAEQNVAVQEPQINQVNDNFQAGQNATVPETDQIVQQQRNKARRPKEHKEPERSSLRVFNKEHGASMYIVSLPRSRQNDDDCKEAKQVELTKLKDFQVYDEVQNLGQSCISTRWVLWEKGDKKEVRARLVARGFEEQVDVPIDSPTVNRSTMRMMLAVSVAKHWTVKATDIKSAFLQGSILQRDVYLKPPKEANVEDGTIWKLKRCLYGLNDAARKFYDSVVEELQMLGCKKSYYDPSLFSKVDQQVCSGILVSHIDDFLHAGDLSFDESVTKKLCSRFLSGKNVETEFKYTGYQITQSDAGIIMDQNSYIAEIPTVALSANREMQKNEHLNSEEATQYRSLVGSLNWLVQGTRPDLFFQLIELSTKFRNSTVGDLIQVRKIIQKAKDSKCEVCFPDLGPISEWRVVTFTDASFANLNNGTDSCIGYIIFLVGKDDRACPLTWKSGKAKRVVKSTLGAEAMSLLEGIEASIYLKIMIVDVLHLTTQCLPITIVTDHKGLWESLYSTHLTEDRRLRIDLAAAKESLQKAEIQEVRVCSSAQQLADCLTKKNADSRKLLSVLQSGRLDLQF